MCTRFAKSDVADHRRFAMPTLMALVLFLAGCPAHRDSFTMRNPTTGQEVMCYSGYYTLYEGAPQIRIADQCIHACERYGFKRLNTYESEKPEPRTPDEEMREYIPAACQ